MFTGIIEEVAIVEKIVKSNTNLNITIRSNITSELKIDQSVAHNGICLTVVNINSDLYTVTAINETISKTNISELREGDKVNIERAMKLGDRLDGHIVQGHIDQTGVCNSVENKDGSWIYNFTYDSKLSNITIEKGSITINGVSLTVVNSTKDGFSIALIPYTHENTNFNTFKKGTIVNLEFDVIGKYVSRLYNSDKI
ncbi:MAG: riboflavin synthase [Flavobacteriaceae bacterium]|nr:riboflavin synthase [Flavobacteriaceae bacterium]